MKANTQTTKTAFQTGLRGPDSLADRKSFQSTSEIELTAHPVLSMFVLSGALHINTAGWTN